MNKVMNEPGGTGYAFRGRPDPGFEMAGKTGTAQVRAYSQAEHASGITKNSALAWKLRDHALFIGFAPVAAPRYACACIIEHGATPEHFQVLAARDILTFAQKRKTLELPTSYPIHSASLTPAGSVPRPEDRGVAVLRRFPEDFGRWPLTIGARGERLDDPRLRAEKPYRPLHVAGRRGHSDRARRPA